jgi:hypothetical protein
VPGKATKRNLSLGRMTEAAGDLAAPDSGT